jgi:hypothetical protein
LPSELSQSQSSNPTDARLTGHYFSQPEAKASTGPTPHFVLTTWRQILREDHDVHSALAKMEQAIENALRATTNPADRVGIVEKTLDVWKSHITNFVQHEYLEKERLEKDIEALTHLWEEEESKRSASKADDEESEAEQKKNMLEVSNAAVESLITLLKYGVEHSKSST